MNNNKMLKKIKKSEKDIVKLNEHLDNLTYYADNEAELLNIFSKAGTSYRNTTIVLTKGKYYKLNNKIVFPRNVGRIHLIGNSATLQFNNTDGGLDISSSTYNDGNHVIENLFIIGTNKQYPSSNADLTNTGIGLNIENNGGVSLKNVIVQCFNIGVRICNSLGSVIDGTCYFGFNRIGLVLEGIANANRFFGVKVRENFQIGVYFKSNKDGNPTANYFYGGYIESNRPWNTNFELEGIGVYFDKGYDNVFDGIYFENHKYSIVLKSGCSRNKFKSIRLNTNTHGNDTIKFDGSNINSNSFIDCIGFVNSNTVPTVEASITNSFNNSFINCSGFNLSLVYDSFYIENCKDDYNAKNDIGVLSFPDTGVATYITTSETDGKAVYKPSTKTLNCYGLSGIVIGANTTSATEIVEFTNVKKNSFLHIFNYQNKAPITFKASSRIGKLILNNNEDCILSNYSDSIVFYINHLGRAIEIARNIQNNGVKVTKGIINHNFGTNYGGRVAANTSQEYIFEIKGVNDTSSVNVNCTTKMPHGIVYSVCNNGDNSIKIIISNLTDNPIAMSNRTFIYTYSN